MAWTERYMDAASSGGDGTTNATSGANAAWADFGAAITGVGVGPASSPTRINIKAGTYANTITTRTFNTAGATTAPIWWRGYKASPGDQDTNNVAVAGTDVPAITFSSGYAIVSGTHQWFSNLSFSSTATNPTIQSTAAVLVFYRCRSLNTNANAGSRVFQINGSSVSIIGCYLSATTSATQCVYYNSGGGLLDGSVIVGGAIGVGSAPANLLVQNCVFDSQGGDGISTSGSCHIMGCSFYNQSGNGINITTSGGIQTISNCHFENIATAAKAAINNTSGAVSNFIRAINNSYYNVTATILGQGDIPAIFDQGTLAGSGFTAPGSQNFSATTYLKALGFPGLFENVSAYQGYMDLGAVQRQESSAGILVHPGMTGGMHG